MSRKTGGSSLDRASARELPIEKCSGEYEWFTPPDIIEAAQAVLGDFDLDPASNDIAQIAVRARRYFTRENDGLTQKWAGRVWINPPYSKELIEPFVVKLVEHVEAGDISEAILLVDNRTDTAWFHRAANCASRICFTRGRIRFLQPDGQQPGTPTNGSALLYFGADPAKFTKVFGEIGLVVLRHGSDLMSAMATM